VKPVLITISIVMGAVLVMPIMPFATGEILTSPVLADPDKFSIELCADLVPFGRLNAFQLTFNNGENGFPAGLYATSGIAGDDSSDRMVRIEDCLGEDGIQEVKVVHEGFQSNEAMLFARGAYGEGMLVTDPLNQQILRITLEGGGLTSESTFASGFTTPFGPANIAYGPDPNGILSEVVYATDFSSGNIVVVYPNGTISPFASLGDVFDKAGPVSAGHEEWGGAFLAADFNFDTPDIGTIYAISADGQDVNPVVTGLNWIELISFGPGGAFGSDLYVPTFNYGGLANDGTLYTLSPNHGLKVFMTGIDVASVAFDTNNILGGGMFVADFGGAEEAGKIWRITPLQLPPVGGEILGIDVSTLMLAGIISNSYWILPVILGAIGIAILGVKRILT
jgi:hypothetical protein